MKILTGTQIKEADRYTIEHEPVSSIDLMERASVRIYEWISSNIRKESPLLFLVGKGNNGGDGLAVARLLSEKGYSCSVHIPFDRSELTEECLYNLNRLPSNVAVVPFEDIDKNTIIIDSLLGTGVKGKLKEPLLSVIEKVNSLDNKVISIDLPSGMMSEFENNTQTIVQADVTLTLEFPKLAMLLPEAGEYCGNMRILPIGLSKEYIEEAHSLYRYITSEIIQELKPKRETFAHKGTYGHALLICGSKGMVGAAVLSTGAVLRSGCGLVTLHIPAEERFAVQVNHPSAILSLDAQPYFSSPPHDLSKYSAIGIGSGMGQAHQTIEAFKALLQSIHQIPLVIDADALNIIAEHYRLKQLIPENSILTPHLGELRRLVGDWKDEEEKLSLVRKLAATLKSIVVVKGAHTMVCLPDGMCYFNSTGNSGMAKGGSGDVLTGYITGLLARGCTAKQAAILGVYIHGLAGDKAAEKYGLEAMNSKDIIDFLGY